MAKLNDEQQSEIRALRKQGWTQAALAKHFGTSLGSVQRTLNPIQLKGIRLTDEQRSEIRALRKQDPKHWTYAALMKRFGVSQGAVQFALDPEKWSAYRKTPKARANRKKHERLYRALAIDAGIGYVIGFAMLVAWLLWG